MLSKLAMMPPPKKLIEVALPLKEINAASAREKSIRHGHPSTLHLWVGAATLGSSTGSAVRAVGGRPIGLRRGTQVDLQIENLE